MNYVYNNKDARYVVINKEKEKIPMEIRKQTLVINYDINNAIM